MTAPGQVITATPPAAPTVVSAVPAPPTMTVPPPTASLTVIDGRLVPVIPPYLIAAFSGTTVLTAPFNATSVLPGSGTGLGALSAVVGVWQPVIGNFGGTGSAAASVVVGGGSKAVVSASFATEGLLRVRDASFGAVGGLSAAIVPKLTAAASFYGVGSAIGVQPAFATATFATTGAAAAVTGQLAQWSGSGALSCAVVIGMRPAGMTKSGAAWSTTINAQYAQITGWTADTTNYPGSSVSSDGLVASSSKSNANLAASIVFTGGSFSDMNVTLKLAVNGTPVITGAAKSVPAGSTTTVTVTGNATLNANDKVSVLAVTDSSLQAVTANANSASWVRIS
ncbi:hypothetical protein VMT65_22365 [Nocardia sp. CDC153]|uniref:hypothetical protein n=1 Tax=Nocardia sp. CDC153 TaxID=3112167 RepID=UPI002DB76C51|nr:hypothetical protein [Nocardia sp. CDC153]MEC3955794.1 hypothetical protein [Nocardia sp. CDC153]